MVPRGAKECHTHFSCHRPDLFSFPSGSARRAHPYPYPSWFSPPLALSPGPLSEL